MKGYGLSSSELIAGLLNVRPMWELHIHEFLECLIQGATAEVAQKWAIFALPKAPQQYTSYDGTQMPITEQMALDEFKFQTGFSPLKFYRSTKNPLSSTLIMAIPKTR